MLRPQVAGRKLLAGLWLAPSFASQLLAFWQNLLPPNWFFWIALPSLLALPSSTLRLFSAPTSSHVLPCATELLVDQWGNHCFQVTDGDPAER